MKGKIPTVQNTLGPKIKELLMSNADRILKIFGYQVTALKQAPTKRKGMLDWLRDSYAIDTIIDIGASDGEYGHFLFNFFKASKMFAFEPLPDCIDSIKKRYSGSNALRVFNVALSDNTGESPYFVNSYRPASSLLEINQLTQVEFPETTQQNTIAVKVETLDNLISDQIGQGEILIKIDVQGLEDKVIKGGQLVFSKARALLIEVSFVELYKNQVLFHRLHILISDLGYKLAGMKNQTSSKFSGRPLFMHCLYLRENFHR